MVCIFIYMFITLTFLPLCLSDNFNMHLLKQGIMIIFQLKVRVFDSIYPDNFDEEVLTIQVSRNAGQPSFINLNDLIAEIWDTHPLGGFVLDTNATDTDAGVRFP